YRVHIDNPEIDGPDGPILPVSQEWREPGPFKHKDNHVDVSAACLSGSKYESTLASSQRSSTFSVILPSRDHSHSPVPPKPEPLTFKIPSLTASIPPLFLAPPFTPSHPVFHSVSRHAIKASDELRKQAEQEIDAFIKKKLVGLEEVEEQLKADTELLWKEWRDAWNEKVGKVEEVPETRRRSSGNVPRVSNFSPQVSPTPASPPVQQPLSPEPRLTSVSLLSASLAQSSLHAHMGQSSSSEASPSAVAGSEILDGLSPPKAEDGILEGPFRRVADDSFAIAASFKIGMEEENELAARRQEYLRRQQERQAALERAAKEKAKAEEEEGKMDRGRSSTNARRVQFADGTKEEDEGANGPEDSGEPEMFDFDPPTEFEATSSTRAESRDSQDASVTPTASPRRRSAPLTATAPAPASPAVEEENREPGQTQAEQQFMTLVGADLPSHRRAWKNDRTSWKVFTDASNVSEDRSAGTEDDDAASDLSDERSWKNPSVAAQSLPVTIGLGRYMSGEGSRQPKGSVSNKPGESDLSQARRRLSSTGHRVSASVATRQLVYATRDINSSMDPGFAMNDSAVAEEDEEEDVTLPASSTEPISSAPDSVNEKSRQRALLILQKSKAKDATEAAGWR
ncbi:hypothetical protein FRC01_012487, partial [Tulasnella sp. 417]